MLPRLLFGAAAFSVAVLAITRERRNGRVYRFYDFHDQDDAFDRAAGVFEVEYRLFGVESSLEMTGSIARIHASRRAHEIIRGWAWGRGARVTAPSYV